MESTEQLGEPEVTGASENVTTSEGKKHFAKNTVSSLIFFVFNVATSLLMVPYLIHHLGTANFGMITLANSFISMTQVLTIVIVGTVIRFVMLYAARDENDAARSYMSTQFTAIAYLAAVLFPIALAISYFAPILVRIPPGQKTNTQLLFLLCYAAFLPTLFVSPLQVAQYIKQRFDIRNALEMINQTFRYGTWIVMFAVMAPSMWHVGLGYLVGSVVTLVGTWIVFVKLTPQLRPELGHFEKSKFREMVRMGGWVTVSQVGTMLYLSVDPLVINRILGPTSVGLYGPILNLFLQVRVLSSLMAGMMMPLAISYYARNDWPGLIRTSAKSVKFMSLGMALPIGIACGFAVPFLKWWLPKPEFADQWLLVWLLLAPQVWNSAMEPLFAINNAANKVAIPGVASVIGGLIKLALAIILLKYTRLGLVGVALANLIAFALKNVVFTPIYAAYVLKSSSKPFYKAIVPATFAFAIIAATAWWVTQLVSLTTFPKILVAGLSLMAVFTLLIYLVALNADDRRFLAQVAPWTKKGPAAQ